MMQTYLDPKISYVQSGELTPFRALFLKHCGKVERFSRNAEITSSGMADVPLYYLLSGMVKVYTVNPHGYIRILGFCQDDSIFAMDRICFDEPAVVSTKAVTDVAALRVTWKDLTDIAAEEPALFPELLKYYGRVLRLMCYDAEVKSIGSVAVRLASFLYLFTAKEATVRLTQEDISSAINASRVQVARILVRFQQEGLIESGRSQILVLDRERLLEVV